MAKRLNTDRRLRRQKFLKLFLNDIRSTCTCIVNKASGEISSSWIDKLNKIITLDFNEFLIHKKTVPFLCLLLFGFLGSPYHFASVTVPSSWTRFD